MPALITYLDGKPHGLMVLSVEDGLIGGIEVFLDPALPGRFERAAG
jgi:hypothetical protein